MAQTRRSGPTTPGKPAPKSNTPSSQGSAPAAVGVVLDWRDSQHWGGGHQRKCRICLRPTFLLDGRGHGAHKVCVEQGIAQLADDFAAAGRR